MNLMTMSEIRLRAAFDCVEYRGFYDWSIKNGQVFGSEYSIWHAFEVLTEPRDEPRDPHMAIATIYGEGGFNRYFVYPDGKVMFSERHGFERDLHTAQMVGFSVFH